MIYEKPKCDCGEELIYYECRSTEYLFKIRKDGEIYKKPFSNSGDHFEYSGLKCVKCDICYHPELSSDGKLIRGERV
ncbi:hypothetical protein [Thermaerobacillus caldiproteolyticus]|uniref:hypothetical protein n=1 Tax=Thermaerobacillus caldiproteolyticus TaxID=247480 RepID=UPI0018F1E4B8|nr:hypothetical protein [Anoxybacillus caldiproteolyticus]